MFPPVSRTLSPAIPDPVIHHNARSDSFPVDWFFNENAAPISEHRINCLKCPKPLPNPNGNQKPFQLSPCVQVYQNIINKTPNG